MGGREPGGVGRPRPRPGRALRGERRREKEEMERLKALAAPVMEVSEAAEILARAHLVAAGYRRRKGEYRRARG